MSDAHAALQREERRLWGLRPVRWGLQILDAAGCGVVLCFGDPRVFRIADFLGIDLDPDGCPEDHAQRLTAGVTARLAAVRQERDSGGLLRRNLRILQRAVGLNDTEMDLIAFRAMLRMHDGFGDLVTRYIGDPDSPRVASCDTGVGDAGTS